MWLQKQQPNLQNNEIYLNINLSQIYLDLSLLKIFEDDMWRSNSLWITENFSKTEPEEEY